MAGQDHVLSKAFLATGAAAYVFGQCVVAVAGTTLDPNQMIQANTTTNLAAFAPTPLGLVQENLDLIKVQTGKAYGTVAIAGIAFGIWDGVGALVYGANLAPSAVLSGRLAVATLAAPAGKPVVGTYIGGAGGTTAAAAAGDIISVLLTPGARY
jgi:hypothetical protein